ncbi:MAG TPA: SLBB domain-containing protein [Candidatus Acidoferrum sp.]|nr:SLBB domain-containing protein [Candidatus Acidoferrum sp.]
MRDARDFSGGDLDERGFPKWEMLILLGATCFLFTSAAQGQQAGGAQGSRGSEQSNGRAAARNTAERMAGRGGDIVADNLDRVAATAEQILEVVNRDAGLMVELKRAIAQDAGESGQIIEESDLSNNALAERLREDLRSRVLATRLLRRYGYLLPRVNPDSELAQEQKLLLQERAQQLSRAAESNHETRGQTEEEFQANCDPHWQTGCEAPGRSLERTRVRGNFADREGAPAEAVPQREDYPQQPSRPNSLSSPRELFADSPVAGPPETLLVSSPPLNPDGMSPFTSRGAGLSSEGSLPPMMAANETPGDATVAGDRTMNAATRRSNAVEVERRYARQGGAAGLAMEMEPGRMVHRSNPYADAPSLYDLYVQASPPTQRTVRFGLDVFHHSVVNPDVLPMDLPVGPDYVLGPGDSLSIDLWGGISQRLFRTVDREGKLALPEAGPLLVSGKSLGEVQEAVQRVLRTQFRDVSADVSLLKLRTVRVYVVGEVGSPGAYDVSSLSTPLNALFAAGGVTANGSLRRLEHYRGKHLLEEADAYDLLLHGIRGDLKRLENGDSLRVPPLGVTVKVEGMVRRPALYELRGEKNLNEVLELAGGILPAAALRHIEVQRLDAHEKRTMLSLEIGEGTDKEALRATFEKFSVQDGDEIHIFPIASYNAGAVYLEGHVLRPGRYSYHEGMKLTDLVASYSDLLPEPSGSYGEIIRIIAPENRPVVETFNLAAALEHPESAPKLQPLDTVRVFSRYDFEAEPVFSVFGEVHHPGRFRSSGQAHFRDAIYEAGGITSEAWEESAQLFRSRPDGTTKVFNISLGDALSGDPLNNILIAPGDRILVHRQPLHVNPTSVYVRGEVARPGRYPLVANMRVSDLLRSAGGLLRSANAASGDLTHYAATSGGRASTLATESQPINVPAALAGEGAEDLALRDGDVLTIPQQTGWKNVGATVTLKGEVAKPGVYGIQPGERVSSLLHRAGGLLPTAYAQAAVFERVDVREMQEKSRQELIQRLEQESVTVKAAVTASGSDEVALQQAAQQQRQRILDGLRRAPVSGRLVVHLRQSQRDFAGSADDIELRAGDTLEIPEQPGFVVIVGQVYNSNAITYSPGKNAGWYLSRAGGATSLANKKAIFIIRANGSVTSGGSMWSGGVLSAAIGPGDTIVVPEKAVLGGNAWKNIVAVAQIAQAAALAAAVAIP